MRMQSPIRSRRSKKLRAKNALQNFLLVAVSIWLLYQLKHSYDKKRALAERNEDGRMDKFLRVQDRMNRKDFLDFADRAFGDDILGQDDLNEIREGDGDGGDRSESKHLSDDTALGRGNEQTDGKRDGENGDDAEELVREARKSSDDDRKESLHWHVKTSKRHESKEFESEYDTGKDEVDHRESKAERDEEKDHVTDDIDGGSVVRQVNRTASHLDTSLHGMGSKKNGPIDGLYDRRPSNDDSKDQINTANAVNGTENHANTAVAGEKSITIPRFPTLSQNFSGDSVNDENSTSKKEPRKTSELMPGKVELELPEISNATVGQEDLKKQHNVSGGTNDDGGAIQGNSTQTWNETAAADLQTSRDWPSF